MEHLAAANPEPRLLFPDIGPQLAALASAVDSFPARMAAELEATKHAFYAGLAHGLMIGVGAGILLALAVVWVMRRD